MRAVSPPERRALLVHKRYTNERCRTRRRTLALVRCGLTSAEVIPLPGIRQFVDLPGPPNGHVSVRPRDDLLRSVGHRRSPPTNRSIPIPGGVGQDRPGLRPGGPRWAGSPLTCTLCRATVLVFLGRSLTPWCSSTARPSADKPAPYGSSESPRGRWTASRGSDPARGLPLPTMCRWG